MVGGTAWLIRMFGSTVPEVQSSFGLTRNERIAIVDAYKRPCIIGIVRRGAIGLDCVGILRKESIVYVGDILLIVKIK
jgi:hypothetical protein